MANYDSCKQTAGTRLIGTRICRENSCDTKYTTTHFKELENPDTQILMDMMKPFWLATELGEGEEALLLLLLLLHMN